MIGNKKLAALATTAVLAAMPLSALAQAMDAQAMEARMAQLEQEMQQMRDMLQAYQQRDAANAANAAAAPTATATALDATRVAAPAAPAVVMPNAMPGTKFSFGGFIKLDSMYTRTSDGEIADGSAGRLFYFPGATPVAADGRGQSGHRRHGFAAQVHKRGGHQQPDIFARKRNARGVAKKFAFFFQRGAQAFRQQIHIPCPGIVAGRRIFRAGVRQADNQFYRHVVIPNCP